MFNDFSEALASGSFKAVVTSDLGIIIIMLIASALLIGVLVATGNKSNEASPIKPVVYTGVALALAMALSNIPLFQMPQGGSITAFSMLFVIVIGYFFGLRQGILAGIVYGLLQLAFKPYVVHPVQLLLDYPLAFAMLGLSGGVFAKSKFGLVKGVIIGVTGRLVMHVISGAIFFAEYAPEGMNVWLYSFWYNFTYLAVEGGALTIFVVLIPVTIAAIDRVKKSAVA